jgi:integrase
MGSDRSATRARHVLHGLGRFCAEEGLGPGPVLRSEVIEAFVAKELATSASSTRGTYRSVLRALGATKGPPGAAPYSGSSALSPYAASERAELLSIACSQRAPWKRHSALVAICLGMGAGLRAGELTRALAQDVSRGHRGVVVYVRGDKARAVKVQGPYAGLLDRLAGQVPRGAHLFHPDPADRSYPNFINVFCHKLVRDPGAPLLCTRRLRSSFICDHLAAGTRLSELLEQSGISEVESLLRYARHVSSAPQSKAALRQKMHEG